MDQTRVSASEFDRLKVRLAKLEQQNRRAKMLLLMMLIVGAASVAMVQAVPQERPIPIPPALLPQRPLPPAPPGPPSKERILEGTELRLLDSAGHERLVIAGGDFPIVSFLDARGRTKMRLGLTPRGPTVGFYDESGKYSDLAGPFTVRPLTQ